MNSNKRRQIICADTPFAEVQAVKNSFYGKPRKPVHLKNVHCTGQEQQVLFCTYIEFSSLEEKKEILSQVEVAGVLCLNQTGNQANTTSGQNCTRELTSSTVLLVPTYLTAMLLLASLLLFLV